MAYVTKIVRDEREFRALHPTNVDCRYLISENDGRKVLQLNTYGSGERQHPEKLSQTLQFDENAARDLFNLLALEFGFSKK